MVNKKERLVRRKHNKEHAKFLIDKCDSFVIFGYSQGKGSLIFNHIDNTADDASMNLQMKHYLDYQNELDRDSVVEYLKKMSGETEEERSQMFG